MFFASVKLTVYTLVLLALTSIIGTVVLQNGSPRAYVNLYGQGMYNLIQVLKLDNMYQAWWYLLLMLVLCINIVVCSIDRLSKTWKIIFPDKIKVNPKRFNGLKNKQEFESDQDLSQLLPSYQKVLSRQMGAVIEHKTEQGLVLYGEKGRWSRLGVYVVHASVLLLLAGALFGALFGFKASLRLDEGKSADTVLDSSTRMPIKLPFAIRCNEFEVKFYDTGAPDEFRSNLTIIEDGKQSFTKDIRVNYPLRYKGINIFQSSYGTALPNEAEFEIKDNLTQESVVHTVKKGQSVALPQDLGTFTFEGFLPHFDFRGHNLGEAFVGRVAPKDKQSVQIVMPTKFPTFDKMRKGQFSVTVKDFHQAYYTGLQVTKDPGVWYVYSGFILMIIGCWITFFLSHQSVCIGLEKRDTGRVRVWVAGKANRNTHAMTLKIKKFATQLKEI
ncbi:MAG: cytochrome c biogenesis protein ResB [Desulfobacter sp.]|nr:cytochrome c biogenesis protein ResB [Desulfobacter sp.]WDP88074.1 MAG: cytochrome c biogenesis protein ResB [Desulfobacter sp.]